MNIISFLNNHKHYRLYVLLAVFIAVWVYATSSANHNDRYANDIAQIKEDIANLQSLTEDMQQLKSEISILRNSSQVATNSAGATQQKEEPLVETAVVLNNSYLDDPYIGNRNANVVLMAFYDYQCLPCRTFAMKTFPRLQDEYINNNKVKFILRDYPLEGNTYAIKAASFAHCAGEQNKYWDAFKLLNNEAELVDNGSFDALALKLKDIDSKKLQGCVASARYQDEAKKDLEDGKSLGVKGAPGFYAAIVNPTNSQASGIVIRGAQPYAVIRHQLESLLYQKRKAN
ncbi:MAG: thioredoxin domain-containing protein [Deltaproteobacteria bacterium]|nr:thioredoxin domain-containing protein [Deltaproteobacteria bacterium]